MKSGVEKTPAEDHPQEERLPRPDPPDPSPETEPEMGAVRNVLSASPEELTQEPKQEKTFTGPTSSETPSTPPDTYETAPFVSRKEVNPQPGDFIRYLKEDGIIYQGTVKHGTPVENGFNPYDGQEEDLVVHLNFDDGKHVAADRFQHSSPLDVRLAAGRTAYGRNVEVVHPDEIIAVSPENTYDWYRFKEAWDEDDETPYSNDEDS